MIPMLMEVLKLCFDSRGIFADKISIAIVGILSSAAEMAANDTNLDVLVKVMLFNQNAKKINLFSLYSPLFTYPTPNIELKSYTFKYNRSPLVLINS